MRIRTAIFTVYVAASAVGLAVLTVVLALIMAFGATFGGAMVFEYGFNVETAGDHPAWHKSDVDVFHGQPHQDTPPT